MIAAPGCFDCITARLVEVSRGVSRHEVLFVSYRQGVYALKEQPSHIACKMDERSGRGSPKTGRMIR